MASNQTRSTRCRKSVKNKVKTKLERAIKRTIEDEIPYLDTYILEQKAIHQLERMSRSQESKEMSKTEECYLHSGKFHHVTNRSVKSVDLDDDVVKRTICDEIPYLFKRRQVSIDIQNKIMAEMLCNMTVRDMPVREKNSKLQD